MFILTDTELRARWFTEHKKTYMLPDGPVILTPAAKDFIKEHEITLIVNGPSPKEGEKPEDMTHLRGNILVHKSHPQIVFRGKLDSIEAKVFNLQVTAAEDGFTDLEGQLEEILDYVKAVLKAEVTDSPVQEMKLFGLDSDGLRYETHHVKEIYGFTHPTPDHHMGRVCMELNDLRAMVREGELAAASAFKDKEKERPDIIRAMNRLSSAVYILFLRQLKGSMEDGEDKLLCTRKAALRNDPAELPEEPAGKCGMRRQTPGIMVEASGRHVHLTEDAINTLFGEPLHEKSPLSQPGQYASQERVKLVTPKGEIDNVIVLGPPRNEIQVEMSLTDARILGINIPVNMSGDLKGAGDVILVGPKGIYNAPGSAIAARAHIHMTPEDAKLYDVEDGDSVSVRIETERPVTISEVIVRVSDKFALAMHIDYDEANACLYKKGDLGYIVK